MNRTPLIRSWPGILTVPLIGEWDSERTAALSERVLRTVREERVQVLIVHMSELGDVDTYSIRRILDLLAAARAMGTLTLASGIRGDTAATLVELGLDLDRVETFTHQSDALARALGHLGLVVAPRPPAR